MLCSKDRPPQSSTIHSFGNRVKHVNELNERWKQHFSLLVTGLCSVEPLNTIYRVLSLLLCECCGDLMFPLCFSLCIASILKNESLKKTCENAFQDQNTGKDLIFETFNRIYVHFCYIHTWWGWNSLGIKYVFWYNKSIQKPLLICKGTLGFG